MTLEAFEDAERERIEREGCTPYDGPSAAEIDAYLTARAHDDLHDSLSSSSPF
jgi:hypothetical protein